MIPKRLLDDILTRENELRVIIGRDYPNGNCEIEYYVTGNEGQGISMVGISIDELKEEFPKYYGLGKSYNGYSITVEQHLIVQVGDGDNEDWDHPYTNHWALNK